MANTPSIRECPVRPIAARDILAHRRPGDAAALARLLNESGRGWPAGFGHGHETADSVRRMLIDSPSFAAYTTWDGRRMVGYCTLWKRPGQGRWAYVSLLTCHPDYHGKGHGKALMVAAVDRAARDGCDVLYLNTWIGNRKALGVYQRTGFHWEPRSTVSMTNFIPAIRRNPLGRRFFAERHWLAAYQREVTCRPDERLRDTRIAYEYSFRGDDGAMLRFVFDHRAELPVEIEDDRFLIALHQRNEEPVAGVDQTLRIVARSKTGTPVPVSLAAGGDPAVKVRYSRTATVGRRFADTLRFRIDPAAEPKRGDPEDLLLWIDATVDGVPMRLGVGFEPRPPIDVSLADAPADVAAGGDVSLKLKIESRLKTACRLRGRVRAAGGRLKKAPVLDGRLAARGRITVPLDVHVADAAALRIEPALTMAVAGGLLRPRIEPLHLAVRAQAGCGGWVERESVRLTGPMGGASMRRTGWSPGGVHVSSALGEEPTIGLSLPVVGPPFQWAQFFADGCQATVRRNPGRMTAVLTGGSCADPTLRLRREVTFGADGLVRVRDFLRSTGASPRRLGVRYAVTGGPPSGGRWTLPGDGCVLIEPAGWPQLHPLTPNFPVDRLPWPEPWVAFCRENGGVGGAIWQRHLLVRPGHWQAPASPFLERLALRPREWTPVATFHLVAGGGDWSLVRTWWQRLRGGGNAPAKTATPRQRATIELRVDGPDAEPGLEHAPIWLPGGRGSLRVTADAAICRQGDVEAVFPADGPIRFTPQHVRWPQLRGPARRTARVSAQAAADASGPQAASFTAGVHLARQQRKVCFIVPRAGAPQAEVRAAADGTWTLDNGLVSATAAPQFGGAMISLIRDGRQWLDCPWPQAGEHPWYNPWFGGVSPMAGGYGGRFHQGRFSARAVELRRCGMVFRGVQILWQPRRQDRDKRRLFIRYLLTDGVPAVRCELQAAAAGTIDAELHVFGLGLRAPEVRTYTDRLEDGFLEAAPRAMEVSGARWVLAERPPDGRTLCVAAGSKDGTLSARPTGFPACTASLVASLSRAGGGGGAAVCWIVPCADLAEARQWSVLAGLPGRQ